MCCPRVTPLPALIPCFALASQGRPQGPQRGVWLRAPRHPHGRPAPEKGTQGDAAQGNNRDRVCPACGGTLPRGGHRRGADLHATASACSSVCLALAALPAAAVCVALAAVHVCPTVSATAAACVHPLALVRRSRACPCNNSEPSTSDFHLAGTSRASTRTTCASWTPGAWRSRAPLA